MAIRAMCKYFTLLTLCPDLHPCPDPSLYPVTHSIPAVRATLERHGGYTVTWADRGENQRVNNHPKYNKGDLT